MEERFLYFINYKLKGYGTCGCRILIFDTAKKTGYVYTTYRNNHTKDNHSSFNYSDFDFDFVKSYWNDSNPDNVITDISLYFNKLKEAHTIDIDYTFQELAKFVSDNVEVFDFVIKLREKCWRKQVIYNNEVCDVIQFVDIDKITYFVIRDKSKNIKFVPYSEFRKYGWTCTNLLKEK